jgi:hypothetical protein
VAAAARAALGGAVMIERKSFSVDGHCDIALTLEQMSDGTWGVVASIKHIVGSVERVTDLPVPDETFSSEADAEAFGLRMARKWLETNMPRAA